MNIHYAVRDDPGSPSVIIGAFSSDEKAMGACQDDADEESDGQGEQLTWQARLDRETAAKPLDRTAGLAGQR